jgi:hypothetical protein
LEVEQPAQPAAGDAGAASDAPELTESLKPLSHAQSTKSLQGSKPAEKSSKMDLTESVSSNPPPVAQEDASKDTTQDASTPLTVLLLTLFGT